MGTAIRSRARLAGYVLLLLSLAPLPVAAQQIQVTLDPAQTTIEWTLVTTLHTVHGTFKMKSGTISFDTKSGTASGLIIVAATSGDSDNHARDSKMQKEVLESQRYPEVTFIPQRVFGGVPQTGNSTIRVQGLFHIHGSDHDLTLSIPIAINGNQVKASTSFTVPYQDWGMKDPGNFLLHVDKKVAVNVSTVGRLTQANGAPAAH
ncbi:MAG: YceI family protein [Candidatus Korobacteraceae bacterium]